MRFRSIPIEEVDWAALDQYKDRTCSQRRPWLAYLSKIGAGMPVIAVLEDGGREIGCFIGMGKRIYGVNVLGSPMKGWNTAFMGLNLSPIVPQADALKALRRFAFFE